MTAEPSLFLSEKEIARRVLPPGERETWRSKALVLERTGLPPIDPLMGGRYWPAVRAFFDRRYGLKIPASDMDDMEIPECPPMKRRRPA